MLLLFLLVTRALVYMFICCERLRVYFLCLCIGHGNSGMSHGGRNKSMDSPMDTMTNFPNVGEKRLEVMCPGMVTEDQLHRLFDVVPGLEYCNMDKSGGEREADLSRYVTKHCVSSTL